MDEGELAVGLAVGAGGPTGGPFIDAALAVLADRTGWRPESSTRIVGTSAGAFVASRVGPPERASADAARKLVEVSEHSLLKATMGTRLLRGVRSVGGRTVALLAPSEREQALYDVSPRPYHPGASVVTVQHKWGGRCEHNLSANEDLALGMVRASASIPFKNGPIDIAGRLHIDGAVHSTNNVDLLDPVECPAVVVVSPMIPSSGGKLLARLHRAQLIEELRPWNKPRRWALVIMPNEEEHANRRERELFRDAGTKAAERLFA